MLDMRIARYWSDSSAIVGDGTDPALDYARAVHLTVYWGQDMSACPVCTPAHPPRRLTEKLRRGLPLLNEEVFALGEGRWPLPDEAFSLSLIPPLVKDAQVKKGGTTSWLLTEPSFFLRKHSPVLGCIYLGEVAIERGPPVRIRQRVMHAGARGPIPGIPNNLKLISAVCGLYDGAERLLPQPMEVDTAEQAERFVALVESGTRQQPVLAVACAPDEPEEAWRADTTAYARDAFTQQHAAAITVRGVRHLREMLGPHAVQEGAIKTYWPGFTSLDVPQDHPLTNYTTVMAHEQGRKGMLTRWRNRLMELDAWERRGDPIDIPKPEDAP